METVAKDLFEEWEREASEIQTASLQAKSRQSLRVTKRKFAEVDEALRQSESRIQPVLQKLHDQVLFLKHNLNAQALNALKTESASIQKEIESLLKDLDLAVSRSDQFIKDLDTEL